MSIKHKLLGKNRKLVKSIEIDVGGEKVRADIRKPTFGDRAGVLESARKAGDLKENNEPTSERAGLRLLSRIAACVLFDPETKQRIFGDNDLDDLLDEGWLEDHMNEFKSVFNVSEETARGNSNATPS